MTASLDASVVVAQDVVVGAPGHGGGGRVGVVGFRHSVVVVGVVVVAVVARCGREEGERRERRRVFCKTF